MALTLAAAAELLDRHHLLREIIQGNCWTDDAANLADADEPFTAITYDTRKVVPGTLLCCKGRFKADYLTDIDQAGLAAYMAETEYSAVTHAPGLIVNDARKAMSLLSAEFYGRPQDELTVIGITGTKGKTTTAYFVQAVLNAYSGGRAALFSSVDNCLDGHTYAESDLTTPESMDAFRMMREAANNGMRYLVMEVSSQAYKVERVYGLTFDAGAFLNISPDHISAIEHPTFEDYLYCKRQITHNCRTLVLGADCDHADLIRQECTGHHFCAACCGRARHACRFRRAAGCILRLPVPGAGQGYWRFLAGTGRRVQCRQRRCRHCFGTCSRRTSWLRGFPRSGTCAYSRAYGTL